MSSGSRMVMPGARSAVRVARRFASTEAASSSSSSSIDLPTPPPRPRRTTSISSSSPPIYASLILSRPPLLQHSPSELESTYHASNLALRNAISNPTPTNFYFRAGSLPARRFDLRTYEYESATFGKSIAGKAPDVGDIPGEPEVTVLPRDKWEKEDAARKEKSLERWPEEEIFCLVKEKGKWKFPTTRVQDQEVLHEAVDKRLTGVQGALGGEGLDSWLVTKKPIGVVKNGEERTFFLRSHVLAGEPKLSKSSPWSEWAWLSSAEVQARLRKQGDDAFWEDIKGLFGVADDVE
ncbi:hypothetical protein BCR39DRAFT_534699 [Naematelia encephala]|uniref:Large ribosomal subunit protein mL46 N-terminal domain-containing protein n=1 Tax=Naematelia encephala TaxID=71784 RepID=A0A1Y2B1G6_9TREE|nr:hypothetical protein BCR39DRAFT_534699 [Naematelia encephala]